jgi:hypothetical protein
VRLALHSPEVSTSVSSCKGRAVPRLRVTLHSELVPHSFFIKELPSSRRSLSCHLLAVWPQASCFISLGFNCFL